MSEKSNTVDVVAPKEGLSEEGEVIEWKKSVGDAVSEGEVLVELETDKSVQEIESEVEGRLTEILYEAGSEVEPGQVIGRIAIG